MDTYALTGAGRVQDGVPGTLTIDWFLGQEGSVKGYQKVVFLGLPTTGLARVVLDYVLSAPIDKYSLLNLATQAYSKTINIIFDQLSCIIFRWILVVSSRVQAICRLLGPSLLNLCPMGARFLKFFISLRCLICLTIKF